MLSFCLTDWLDWWHTNKMFFEASSVFFSLFQQTRELSVLFVVLVGRRRGLLGNTRQKMMFDVWQMGRSRWIRVIVNLPNQTETCKLNSLLLSISTSFFIAIRWLPFSEKCAPLFCNTENLLQSKRLNSSNFSSLNKSWSFHQIIEHFSSETAQKSKAKSPQTSKNKTHIFVPSNRSCQMVEFNRHSSRRTPRTFVCSFGAMLTYVCQTSLTFFSSFLLIFFTFTTNKNNQTIPLQTTFHTTNTYTNN